MSTNSRKYPPVRVLIWLSALWLCQCTVPRTTVEYRKIMADFGFYDRERETAQDGTNKTLEGYTDYIAYHAAFPFCQREKRGEEFILDYSLALDQHCDGDTTGFHFFSFLEYGDTIAQERNNVVLISYSLDYWNGMDNSVLRNQQQGLLDVHGAVTVLSGRKIRTDSLGELRILIDRKDVYANPSKVRTFYKSKEKKAGITPDFRPRLTRKVDYVLYYTKEKSGSEQRIVLTRIINKGINQVGGTKPLVFDLARIHNGGIELTQMRR